MLRRKRPDLVLWSSVLAGATRLGVVTLLPLKPGWVVALVSMVVAAILGLVLGQPP
jgi:hypothetical protein